MRIAAYYRVSTEDQTTEPQRIELLEYSHRRGWTNIREYRDSFSGAKPARIGLEMLMRRVRKHPCDTVLVAKLDRLGRRCPQNIVKPFTVARKVPNQLGIISSLENADGALGVLRMLFLPKVHPQSASEFLVAKPVGKGGAQNQDEGADE